MLVVWCLLYFVVCGVLFVVCCWLVVLLDISVVGGC